MSKLLRRSLKIQLELLRRLRLMYVAVGIKDDKQLDWSDFPVDEFEGLIDLYMEVHAGGSAKDILTKYQDKISTSVLDGLRNKLEEFEKRLTLKIEKQNA